MSYDQKCEDLARAFLCDEPGPVSSTDIMDLAQTIQNGIEGWMENRRMFREPRRPWRPGLRPDDQS